MPQHDNQAALRPWQSGFLKMVFPKWAPKDWLQMAPTDLFNPCLFSRVPHAAAAPRFPCPGPAKGVACNAAAIVNLRQGKVALLQLAASCRRIPRSKARSKFFLAVEPRVLREEVCNKRSALKGVAGLPDGI